MTLLSHRAFPLINNLSGLLRIDGWVLPIRQVILHKARERTERDYIRLGRLRQNLGDAQFSVPRPFLKGVVRAEYR